MSMFDDKANSNTVSTWIYLIVAIVLVIIDRPLGALALIMCSCCCSICAAIYRTAGKR